jgi:hypothetical protein
MNEVDIDVDPPIANNTGGTSKDIVHDTLAVTLRAAKAVSACSLE